MNTEAIAEHIPASHHGKRWIEDWRPEDRAFWDAGGKRIAFRNLVFSILTEHIGFSVWSLWSAFVLFLGPEYGFDPSQKFLLTAAPAAVGAAVRIPYSFAVATFGGRNWTIISALLLLVPCVLTGIVLEPGVSFTTLLLVAATAGVGGGNFASSMVNISAFYPQRLKGWALGLNAGGGNVGVATLQLVALLVLATSGASHPKVLLLVYIPLVAIAALCAAVFMDNLVHMRNDKRALRDVTRYSDTWFMSFLYIGTFGSFIGFSFAFGQVLLVQFPETFAKPIDAAYVTFLGPLVGSLIRPVGGALADRFGGARITAAAFLGSGVAAAVVLTASTQGSLPAFITGFLALFVFSGIGNGSTYKMIPSIFAGRAAAAIASGQSEEAAHHESRRLSGAAIGISSAIGAFGGVLVNVAFRESFLANGNGDLAYIGFIGFYAVCFLLTAVVYLRSAGSRLVRV
ncbi:MAG: NarK/NasA family nitrate transporter [Thermoleophilia bacterium]|nr:NarK/NasA family nitrate transporter [Thermoleophilia bacterium]